jgi:transcription-repair coupling factor (superfamily II helicase)
MKREPLPLRFEKILDRSLERIDRKSATDIEIFGTDSSLALALILTQASHGGLWEHPQLVLVPNERMASEFEKHLRFFDSEMRILSLPAFDVSPYSGLYPNPRLVGDRVRWAHEAQNPGLRQIFITTVEAFQQRTVPPEVLRRHTFVYRRGDELPSDFARALGRLGYQATPIVEDQGTFAVRGGIVDVFSPAHDFPVRIELFGDTVDSIRFFNPETQRSEALTDAFTIIPPREVLYDDENRERAAGRFRENVAIRKVDETDREAIMQGLVHGQLFPGLDFLIGDFYEAFSLPVEHFKKNQVNLWLLNPIEIERTADLFLESLLREFSESAELAIRPAVKDLYVSYDQFPRQQIATTLTLSKIEVQDHPHDESEALNRISVSALELRFPSTEAGADPMQAMLERVHSWRDSGFSVFIAAGTHAQCHRLTAFFEKSRFHAKLLSDDDFDVSAWVEAQSADAALIHLVPRSLSESLRLNDEQLVFLRDEDFFGKKQTRRREHKSSGSIETRANALSFQDLNPGDAVVHVLHGIGTYEGLKLMPISGVEAEFITLSYKDGDKLYLPIYRISQVQKYSGPRGEHLLDKLGGTQWQKTKIKVRNHLRDLANDLLQLYAKRSQIHRPPFPSNDDDFAKFEGAFPYDETDDQLKAIDDIVSDMISDKPMDRLVCGDVGFGKTEVAMRAAFKAVEGKKQVAVLAPTTILSFQHLETFQRRFKNWPVTIRALNRFVSPQDVKKTVSELREGQVDIIIGTHRLLSKDIVFKDLGLLIIDEEQRFGVTHKEKVRKFKIAVDTLTLSATPIPRTLNMSLVGMRDLSIINTPPIDRLPTRTFVTRFDRETIRKAITAEIGRGGQVFFLHNRVQSIYALAENLKEIVPDARIRIGHGQMNEDELEQVMVAFYHHQIDVLVCTTIIESGIDNPRANTMFIDNANQLGLSQLYQLRGRVGRSKERAYCYLLIPQNKRIEKEAQERLKIIQENTALGSGIRIAHHDLELRGSGDVLGEDQSGHIDAVGYEMYLELLEQAIADVKGQEVAEAIEPDINVRIPALIPDSFISDIRIRLSYYKALSEISSPDDIDRIEAELADQFGKIPEQVTNLMGLMLIRYHCRELAVRDLSSGVKTISLAFVAERTPLPPSEVVQLASRAPKKYSITPDMRLIVRMDNINWPNIYDELQTLRRLCPPAPAIEASRSVSGPRGVRAIIR